MILKRIALKRGSAVGAGAILVALGLAGLSGCKTVEEGVAERGDEILAHYGDFISDPSDLPVVELDWETALSMLDSNLVMRNAAEEIIKAEVSVRRVFWDLVPQLTVQGIYSDAVTELTNFDVDNLNANVNAVFSIPGLVQLRMDYYAAMLATYGARQQYEMTYRGEVVNLYALFRQTSRNRAQQVAESLQASDPSFGGTDRRELEFSRKQRDRELWLGISAALGDYSKNWKLVPVGLPERDYLNDPPAWDDPEEVGKLFITLEALELESARLRELGIKFQYWPKMSMRLYSPSVYLVSGGDRSGFEFDADDIRFETSVRMRLDTDLQIRDQLREARRSSSLLRQKLYEDAQDRAKKLADARAALAMADRRMRQLAARRKMLADMPAATSYDAFEQNRAERIELINQTVSLEQETDGLVALLWIADESRWWVTDAQEIPAD
ncbi:hypothetical protein [Pontiella sp.]|uniref:hypothetical protein n=1 Tax=Pontiella sp. TaxID=2837462 RepID=UPI0035688C33